MSSHADAVEARILADLRPVRPLARPWRRGLVVCAVGVAIATGVTLGLGVRKDAALLGPAILWGLSALQAGYGVQLIAAALRESVPGRDLGPGVAPLLIVAGAGLALTITMVTWLAHARQVPVGHEAAYWNLCLVGPVFNGIPVLAVALLLAFRAYPTRAALVGALAGFGTGLLSDCSWRTFCEVSDPFHVLPTHLVGVLVLTFLGIVAAMSVQAIRRRPRSSADKPADF